MNADQGHSYFMVLYGKPYKKCIDTLPLPLMTFQHQMNVTDSSMGLCCIHFTTSYSLLSWGL